MLLETPFNAAGFPINDDVYAWISALQSFNLKRSLISSHDLFEDITSVTKMHIKPCDFALASLALL